MLAGEAEPLGSLLVRKQLVLLGCNGDSDPLALPQKPVDLHQYTRAA